MNALTKFDGRPVRNLTELRDSYSILNHFITRNLEIPVTISPEEGFLIGDDASLPKEIER